MDKKIILTTLLAALLGIAGLWLLMSATSEIPRDQAPQPWDLVRGADGELRVFGLRLDHSDLEALRRLLGEEGRINLFVDPDGHISAEAFFDDILLGRLRADWVATLQVPRARLAAMVDRGLRISTLGNGSRKVTPAPDDAQALARTPLRGLTYLPSARLSARDIVGNFGQPAVQITEPETAIAHWLYPDRGVDIARDPKGKIVIQYLTPADFAVALERLKAASTTSQAESGLKLR